MSIHVLTADDVGAYRSIRLRALESDPAAFGSDLAREAAFGDDEWARRLDGLRGRPGQIVVERDKDADVGVVGVGLSEPPSDALLWGMWVDPAARGTGVSRRLIESVKAWATEHGASTVTLYVMASNAPAIALYEREGFELQSDVGREAPAGCEDELRMIFYAAAP